ncbi:hypothetical protein CBM2633_A40345 [Cupriavidus taiwanensis]|nr:hypothetical protein CBM2633_A40345 [Cupriavidus taiwanensis]
MRLVSREAPMMAIDAGSSNLASGNWDGAARAVEVAWAARVIVISSLPVPEGGAIQADAAGGGKHASRDCAHGAHEAKRRHPM